jgi:hypothetical protein
MHNGKRETYVDTIDFYFTCPITNCPQTFTAKIFLHLNQLINENTSEDLGDGNGEAFISDISCDFSRDMQ